MFVENEIQLYLVDLLETAHGDFYFTRKNAPGSRPVC